ncbi:hypothetical protein CHUAL_008459 [Chamberlinius hualienensis]
MARMLAFVVVILASSLYLLLSYSNFKPEEALRGKNVVVTGGSSGIGEQLAYQYAKAKANIIITARRERELNKVAEKCRQLGATKVNIVVADMSIVADRDRLLKETEKHFGKNLDYLILNHAIFPTSFFTGGADEMKFLNHHLEINFASYVDLATRSVSLLEKNEGHIGIVNAVCFKMSCPKLATHAASKGALYGFFTAWRQELRYRNIPVSITMCILSLIDTEEAMKQIKGTEVLIKPHNVAVSADSAATAIIESVALKRYEMYFPKYMLFLFTLREFFVKPFDDISSSQFLSYLES